MKRGTKLKSWKYSSILSFKLSLFVFEKAYGDVSLSIMVNGVMMEFFSLIFNLHDDVSKVFQLEPDALHLFALVEVHFAFTKLESR